MNRLYSSFLRRIRGERTKLQISLNLQFRPLNSASVIIKRVLRTRKALNTPTTNFGAQQKLFGCFSAEYLYYGIEYLKTYYMTAFVVLSLVASEYRAQVTYGHSLAAAKNLFGKGVIKRRKWCTCTCSVDSTALESDILSI